MKNLTLIIILLVASIIAQAQNYSFVSTDVSYTFSDGAHPALKVNMYEVNLEQAEKLTKKWLKDFKGKVKLEDHEFMALGSRDKNMTKLDFNIQTTLIPDGDAFTLVACINLGGAYMNPTDHAVQYQVFKNNAIKFAKHATQEGINSQLSEAKSILKKNSKALTEMVKEKADKEKKIEEAKKLIKEAEGNIKANIEKQGVQKQIIESNNKEIKSIQEKLTKIE